MMDGLFGEAGAVFLFLSVTTVLKHVVQYVWRDRLPGDVKYVGRVSTLFLHPIKSAQGIQLAQAECTPIAMKSDSLVDRQFLIIDEKGDGLSGRQVPQIAAIGTELRGDELRMSAPGQPTIHINWMSRTQQGNPLNIKLHQVLPLEGRDCGEDVAKWLDSYLGKSGHRLVYKHPSLTKRKVHQATFDKFAPWTVGFDEEEGTFQDLGPYMVMTEETLANLNTKLQRPVDLRRFRPNIVVKGTDLHDEDSWKQVIIGDVRFTTLMPCGRCVFTTVDPDTGIMDIKTSEPLKTLRKYRCFVPDLKDSPIVGNLMVLKRPGTIKVGDPVYVTRGDNSHPPASWNN